MFYLYVLQSEKDKKLYHGFSSNLRARFKEHNNGRVASTKNRRPLSLVYYEAYRSEKDARSREYQLKQRANAFISLRRRIRGSMAGVE